jgi:hypothetical protein
VGDVSLDYGLKLFQGYLGESIWVFLLENVAHIAEKLFRKNGISIPNQTRGAAK